MEDLDDISDDEDMDEDGLAEEPAHDIDEESKELEKKDDERRISQPKMNDELCEVRQSSPLCYEPYYRAYLTHQLPQLASLDGLDIDQVITKIWKVKVLRMKEVEQELFMNYILKAFLSIHISPLI